tara:strand:+ start:340 stop:489 length:150 start_codon:yes stop_codon:yes gene_type:complete
MIKEILSYIAITAMAFVLSYYIAPFLVGSYFDLHDVGEVYCTEKGCFND